MTDPRAAARAAAAELPAPSDEQRRRLAVLLAPAVPVRKQERAA